MDTAAIIAKMGCGAPGPIELDRTAYGPWFHRMADEVLLTDEQLRGQDIGWLNIEAAVGLPGAENLNVHACVLKINNWARQVEAFTREHWDLFQSAPRNTIFRAVGS